MRRPAGRIVGAVLAWAALLSASCGEGPTETADTVLFISTGRIAVRGEVEMVAGPEGGEIPYLWSPGTIVVFRADESIAGRRGRAGRAYRIAEGGELTEIGRVDLDKTDDELAAAFGVEPGPPGPRSPR